MLCSDSCKLGMFHKFGNGITVFVNAMCAYYNYINAAAAYARITETIATMSSSVRDLSDHQAGGTCMGTVDTWSRYRQGDCLREKGPLFAWPHSSLSLHLGPAVNFEFQSPFPLPVPALRGRGPGGTTHDAQVGAAGGRRQEAGETRMRRGPAVLACTRI